MLAHIGDYLGEYYIRVIRLQLISTVSRMLVAEIGYKLDESWT